MEWCRSIGIGIDLFLQDVEQINEALLLFDRRLYEAGKTYSHYVETINSLASFKPILRRQLQASWALAFS